MTERVSFSMSPSPCDRSTLRCQRRTATALPDSAHLEADVEAASEVGDLLFVELTVRRKAVVGLEHQPQSSFSCGGVSEFQAELQRDVGLPLVLFPALDVDTAYGPTVAEQRLVPAILESAMQTGGVQLVGDVMEQVLSAQVAAPAADIERSQELDGLEAQVLAIGGNLAQEYGVTQVRALMVDPQSEGVGAVAVREREPNRVIGIDQIVRWRIQIELGEQPS